MLARLGPRAFIDSNIWLYAFIIPGDRTKRAMAKQLIRSVSPVVSVQVVNEVCVNLIKKGALV